MAEKNRQLPLSYRSELLEKVVASLLAGECCSLVGIGGVGKSNLARFLQRHDVQHHYWGDEAVWVLLIDSQSLIFDEGKADYAVLELIAHRLLDEAEKRDSPPEFLEKAQQLYTQLTDKETTHYAFRVIQDLCKRLCEGQGIRLVFVFDQFEDIWQTQQPRFFMNLRHLRDQFKYQIMYLVITRDRLQQMRPDAQAVEAFWELFSAHTYGLGPYNERDASMMIEQIATRTNTTVSPSMASLIIQLAGRHPAMIRAIFWAFYNAQWQKQSVDALLQVSSVTEECKKIWEILSPSEQHAVQLVAQLGSVAQPQADPIPTLRLKGIINDDPPTLFSLVFTAYVQRMPESSLAGIRIDVRKRQVWVDGQFLPQSLSQLEFKLLEYLARHVGEVCQYTDLMRELYNDEGYTRNDQRLYAVLARLRKELGETAQQPRYLITHHGGGVQLLKGGLQSENGDEG